MAGAFSDPGANPVALQSAQQHFLGSLISAVQRIRAAYPHADVLDGLNVAGHAIRAACSYGGTIYLEDSGLQETGLVNFRQPGMLGASPADVVSYLARLHDLPGLAGMTVVLVGAGDTAPPQLPLGISQQDDVVAIWSAIAKAGGAASVRVDPAPLSGPAPAHVPPVLLVPVPLESAWTPPGTPGSSSAGFVFPDSGPVGFEPSTTVFRQPAAAMAALRPLARYLAGTPSARIELTGTTAHWGSLAGCIDLARRRAGTVKAVLVQMGAQPSQIATRGLGWRFPGYVNDQGPDGTLLLGPRLQEETGFQTIVLNDAVAFAERERWLGAGQQTGDFVVMLIRESVGGAIVSDGEHFKGPVEIGNFLVGSVSFKRSVTGHLGVLEVDGGITGVTNTASERTGRPVPDLETAAALADEKGPGRDVSAAFLSAGVAVARGLSYLVQFAGPSHVVLYAPEVMLRPDLRAGKNFLGQVNKFKESVAFKAYRNCELIFRPEEPNNGAEGAALAALNRCFQVDPAAVRTGTGAPR